MSIQCGCRSGITRGGRVTHPRKVWGKFWQGEKGRKRGKKRGRGKEAGNKESENGEEKKGNCKRGGRKLSKMEGKRYGNEEMSRGPFFFFFFFSCHFLKPLKFVWGVPNSNWKFLQGKIGKWEIF